MQTDPILEEYRRVQTKPVIEPSVLTVISKLAQKRLETNDVRRPLQPAARKKLEILASGKLVAGAGIDLEKSRLRQLAFTRIAIEKRTIQQRGYSDDTAMCIVGYTDNVYMEEYGRGTIVEGIWDMGQYEIVVPIPDIPSGKIVRVSFLHVGDEDNYARHPHHTVHSTCWSGFADSVIGAMRDAEIAELMRTLRIFVGRYYSGSPLCHDWSGACVVRRRNSKLEKNSTPMQNRIPRPVLAQAPF